MHATIRPKYVVLLHLFFLLGTTIWPKIRVHTDLFFLFVHNHSTKVYGPLSFILFFCARPFDKNIWSSFIYSLLSARPFDQKLRSTLIHFSICTRPFDQKLGWSLIYFFYLQTTIRPNYRVLFHLFFLQCTTIRPNIRFLIDLYFYLHTTIPWNYWVLFYWFYSFFSARPFDQKLESSVIYFFYLHTAIRQKYMLFFLSFILSLCTAVQPKNKVLINLLFLFGHNYWIKLGVTLTLLFVLFLDVPIFLLLYSWQILPLYFHRSVTGSTGFIFRLLYS